MTEENKMIRTDVDAIMELESDVVTISFKIKELEKYDLAKGATSATSVLLNKLHDMKIKAIGEDYEKTKEDGKSSTAGTKN